MIKFLFATTEVEGRSVIQNLGLHFLYTTRYYKSISVTQLQFFQMKLQQ